MNGPSAFPRIGDTLHCGQVPLPVLAERYGTPLYVYDLPFMEERYRAFESAFEGVDLLVAYSVKANGTLAILHRLASLGAGADIVSEGELQRALRAGIPPERIVFAGVGKRRAEMASALQAGILGFNVESDAELRLLDRVATELDVRAPVALRVNPNILSPTPHEYTRTGHAETKFGIPADEILPLYRWSTTRPHLAIRGIDVHIGSQINDPEPYRRALEEVLGLVDALAGEGVQLDYIDLGGGFGVAYDDQPGMSLAALADAIVPPLRGRGLRLVLEPGRSVVGEAGALLTRVLYVKRSGEKTFVVADGSMTDLLRPSHYGGYHGIDPVVLPHDAREAVVDVVGPVCETGDFLARDRALPLPEPGDLLLVRTAGAYGFAMASNYNSRLRPAEVAVEGDAAHLIRKRETVDDLMRGEVIPTRVEDPV